MVLAYCASMSAWLVAPKAAPKRAWVNNKPIKI